MPNENDSRWPPKGGDLVDRLAGKLVELSATTASVRRWWDKSVHVATQLATSVVGSSAGSCCCGVRPQRRRPTTVPRKEAGRKGGEREREMGERVFLLCFTERTAAASQTALWRGRGLNPGPVKMY